MSKTIDKKQSGIRYVWSMLCQKAIVDKDSNSLTLSDVLEEVTVNDSEKIEEEKKRREGNVAIPLNFDFVTLWDREGVEEKIAEGQTRIIDPLGKTILQKSQSLVFQKGKKRLRFRARFNGMPITVAGEYMFCADLKNEKTGKFEERGCVPLAIKIVDKKK